MTIRAPWGARVQAVAGCHSCAALEVIAGDRISSGDARSGVRLAVVAATIGNYLENYDYFLFAAYATVFAANISPVTISLRDFCSHLPSMA